MIEVKGLSKVFFDSKKGIISAVKNTSFSVKEGEVFGLLGPNGAGKTTLLRMLSTVLKPTEGTAVVNGYDIMRNQENVKKSIGFLSGNTKLYGRLTPKELLVYFGKLYDMKKTDINKRIDEVVTLLSMDSYVNQSIESLSTGQTQRTSIARCVFHDPDIYILDEPTLGLDIMSSKTILEFIKSKANEGKSIIFSTHYMEEAEYLCDRIALMYSGKVLDIKTMKQYKEKTGKDRLVDIFFEYIERSEIEKLSN